MTNTKDQSPIALLIDDCAVNLKVLSRIVKKMGYETIYVEDGQNGLDKCNEMKFDLILTDIHMPFMDGVQMTRMIRMGYGKNTDTPIIGITADISDELEEEARESGFDEWMHKPIKLVTLQEKLEFIVKHKISTIQ